MFFSVLGWILAGILAAFVADRLFAKDYYDHAYPVYVLVAFLGGPISIVVLTGFWILFVLFDIASLFRRKR